MSVIHCRARGPAMREGALAAVRLIVCMMWFCRGCAQYLVRLSCKSCLSLDLRVDGFGYWSYRSLRIGGFRCRSYRSYWSYWSCRCLRVSGFLRRIYVQCLSRLYCRRCVQYPGKLYCRARGPAMRDGALAAVRLIACMMRFCRRCVQYPGRKQKNVG